MKRKFKIGDRVVQRYNHPALPQWRKTEFGTDWGTVVSIQDDHNYPYKVLFDNDTQRSTGVLIYEEWICNPFLEACREAMEK